MNLPRFARARIAAALFFAPWVASGAAITGFGDITSWTGTGANSAALVVDWKDGLNYPAPQTGGQSLAWGFRWDGAATGKMMFDAILAADPRLLRNLPPPTTLPGGPNSIYSLAYDLNGGGLAYVPGADPGFDDLGHAADPADHYKEGWFTAGYWSYWRDASPGSSLPTWTLASGGYASRNLANGSWDGWSWAPGFAGPAPIAPTAAVPEPSALALLLITCASAFSRRRRA